MEDYEELDESFDIIIRRNTWVESEEENRPPYILKGDNELAVFVLQRFNEENRKSLFI